MPFVRSTAPFSEPQNTSSSTSENQSPKDRPKKEIDFPLSDPKYSLDDMIITDEVKEELSTIIEAEKCWKRVFEDWGLAEVMGDRRNLFVNLYGYPGTGKTMAAHAIAKAIGKKMICVNYAEIESKYVGETSKNLTRLFKTASEKNAVIFFDEADAFLSKRVTNMNNSTDVSVNQTRSVLLTLLNDFNGVIIFATNFLSNYDSAFMRRIQYHVKFELPNKELREKLWRRYIPSKMPADIDFKAIADKYDGISGSDISTAVLKAALKAARRNESIVSTAYFEDSIKTIIDSKQENSGLKVTKRPVTEEYALTQIKKANGGVLPAEYADSNTAEADK